MIHRYSTEGKLLQKCALALSNSAVPPKLHGQLTTAIKEEPEAVLKLLRMFLEGRSPAHFSVREADPKLFYSESAEEVLFLVVCSMGTPEGVVTEWEPGMQLWFLDEDELVRYV